MYSLGIEVRKSKWPLVVRYSPRAETGPPLVKGTYAGGSWCGCTEPRGGGSLSPPLVKGSDAGGHQRGYIRPRGLLNLILR